MVILVLMASATLFLQPASIGFSVSPLAAAVPTSDSGMRFTVVYAIFLNPTHAWASLMTQQLLDLKTLGIAARADVHIAISAPAADGFDDACERLLDEGVAVAHSVLPSAHIVRSAGNRYEYPGIRLWYELARKDPPGVVDVDDAAQHHVLLYFHSKGMVNGESAGQTRSDWNVRLTNSVIYPWQAVLAKFASTPELMKAGYAAAPLGWIWFNFAYARASYLRTLVRPILTTRRWYYEDWLGRVNKTSGNVLEEGGVFGDATNSLSMCNWKMGSSWSPDDILHLKCVMDRKEGENAT